MSEATRKDDRNSGQNRQVSLSWARNGFSRVAHTRTCQLLRLTRILLLVSVFGITGCTKPLSDDASLTSTPTLDNQPSGEPATEDSAAQVESPQVGALVLRVAIIAHSVSTSMEARSILLRQHWTETQLRYADAILVVVRSMLTMPLQYHYGSIGDLNRDAELQLNITGESFHVYIYPIGDDLSVTQSQHVHYPARDF